MQKNDTTRFDWTTWQRFVSLARPFFVSELKLTVWGIILLLIGLSLLVSFMNVQIAELVSHYLTALTKREEAEFYRYMFYWALAVTVVTPLAVMYRFSEEKLGLLWRRWLTNKFLAKYFKVRNYYRINQQKELDNPDQRMADEIRSFCSTSLSFILIFSGAVINLSLWTYKLWSISSLLTFTTFFYAFFGSLVTMWIGSRLVALNFIQLRKEADFRYGLIHVRDNSESIAFYGGEDKEASLVRHRLRDALRNLNFLISWHRNLGFFTTGYDYMKGIIPVLVVAPLYLSGTVEIGVITLATTAFGWVLGALSLIVVQFERLSAFAASIARLATLWEEMEGNEAICAWPRPEPTLIEVYEADQLRFENLSVLTPGTGTTLIKDLNFELAAGKSLLITGASGVGKTSLFRAINGLWIEGNGKIHRPPLEQLMFVPQRPYMVLGPMRNQLRYSMHRSNVTDSQLEQLLNAVGLIGLLKRIGGFDTELDWQNVLSLGEQQRLALARVLLAKPKIAFLDEATTALDLENEELMYELIKLNCATWVSVGHRTSLFKYHQMVLELEGNGKWNLREIK